MSNILNIDKNCNYYELVFLNEKNGSEKLLPEVEIYDYDLSKDKFYIILNHINNKINIKPYQKEWKEYLYDDIYYQTHNFNDEIKVHKKIGYNVEIFENWAIIKYIKTKQSPLNFPSTTKILIEMYIKSHIYRITSRIFLNFENYWNAKTNKSGYKIYINYNHDNFVDTEPVLSKLKEITDLFLEIINP